MGAPVECQSEVLVNERLLGFLGRDHALDLHSWWLVLVSTTTVIRAIVIMMIHMTIVLGTDYRRCRRRNLHDQLIQLHLRIYVYLDAQFSAVGIFGGRYF